MNINSENFAKLDFGTQVTTLTYDTITVTIDPKLMLGDFAQAYFNELMRRNPTKARDEKLGLTVEDLYSYFVQILALRILSIEGENSYWRQAKALYIPCWIEAVISMLGRIRDSERGIIIIPTFEAEVDIKAMLDISFKLSSFLDDGVVLHKDAFPRDVEGDIDVMTMAIIDGYVKGQRVTHPLASYIVAFLGMKIQQEEAFKILYRVRYDDVSLIAEMLLKDRTIYA